MNKYIVFTVLIAFVIFFIGFIIYGVYYYVPPSDISVTFECDFYPDSLNSSEIWTESYMLIYPSENYTIYDINTASLMLNINCSSSRTYLQNDSIRVIFNPVEVYNTILSDVNTDTTEYEIVLTGIVKSEKFECRDVVNIE